MVVFPNCKINIGLHILGKREDGFHNLETVFIPVPLHDSQEIIRSRDNGAGVIFSQTGFVVDGNTSDNICVKAYRLLKSDFPQLPAVQMHLHKAIPLGAGLGGGSADGAFALKLLNDKFNLGLSTGQLIEYALALGSDCPFFIINKPCFATGRGEAMQPLNISLAGYHLLLVNPAIHINTGWAFAYSDSYRKQSGPDGNRASKNLLQYIQQPVQLWRQNIGNDFEPAIFSAYPVLQQAKETLYAHGAAYAAMSGSGSTMYGLFEKMPQVSPRFPAGWFVKQLAL